jgi:N-terminal domain on NACHT_NTPase and P-loop NTPases
MDPLSTIASIIAIIQAISSTHKAIQHLKDLPKEFNEVNQNLPLVQDTLGLVLDQLEVVDLDESSKKAIGPIVSGCKEKAKKLQDIFEKVRNDEDGSVLDFYRAILHRLGKAHRVETLMQGILKGLKAVAINQLFRTATQSQVAKLEEAIDKLSRVESSVPDSDFDSFGTHINQNVAEGGTGNQAVNTGDGSMRANFGGYNFDSVGGTMNIGMDIMKKQD